ncbi:hypothetical protein BDF20DRAFT_909256 [Mycotypha africana]|uniref:uncharacterized protein n=1 Tax=Mycotypha africana TaxID=64632 RepID=UPI0022FFC613|nr:uncharacterized protein BDF20DRAFT_909256 [Mycotypha africana]KAI8991481.1 hypothetical protein BDF20DRAFT_909256 [Mycotypha africana]
MSNLESNSDSYNNGSLITTTENAATSVNNSNTNNTAQHLPLRKRVGPAVLKWQPVETPEEQSQHAIDSKPISTTFITSNNNTTDTTTTTITPTSFPTSTTTATYTTPLTKYPLYSQYPTSSIDSDGGGDTTETDEEKQLKREEFNHYNHASTAPPPSTNSNKRIKESSPQTVKPAKKLKRGRPPLNKNPSSNQHSTAPLTPGSSPAMSITAATGLQQQQTKPSTVDNTVLYCICKRPYDAPRFMIACDKCNEWFHGECIEIDEKQSEFIDLYYCDNCSKLTGKKTSWKPKCANPACSKPARIGTNQGHLSKYCTDNCGMQVARARIELAEIKKRNALGASTNGAGVNITTTTVAQSPSAATNTSITTTTATESIPHSNSEEQQIYNPLSRLKLSSFADLDDRARLMRVKDEKAHAKYVVRLVEKKSKFLNLVLQYHRQHFKEKGVCGFDSRLSWPDSTWEKIHDIAVEDGGDQGEDEEVLGSNSSNSNGEFRFRHYIFKDDQGNPVYTNKAYHICQQTKKCNKHADWQKVKLSELEQERSEQFVILTMLERERQQIKVRMKKRREEVDLVDFLENGTIRHFK